MGVFEMEKFAAGTNEVAKTLAECTKKGAITIIGGGDSVAAVEKAGLADQMSHISTGSLPTLCLLLTSESPHDKSFVPRAPFPQPSSTSHFFSSFQRTRLFSGTFPHWSVSPGGGASLELLEGQILPGVAALDNA